MLLKLTEMEVSLLITEELEVGFFYYYYSPIIIIIVNVNPFPCFLK